MATDFVGDRNSVEVINCDVQAVTQGSDNSDAFHAADFVGEHASVGWESDPRRQETVSPALHSSDERRAAQDGFGVNWDTAYAFLAADFVGDHDLVHEWQRKTKAGTEIANARLREGVPTWQDIGVADFVGDHDMVDWESKYREFGVQRATPRMGQHARRCNEDEAFIAADWTGSHDRVDGWETKVWASTTPMM